MGVSRILLLMDNRADSNWGSQATTSALVRMLSAKFPGAELRGAPRSKCRPQGWKRSLSTTLSASLAASASPQSGMTGWALRQLTQGWIDDYQWADLVVVNGEGTLHPQPQAQRWIAAITALTRIHRKPLWVVNCSLQFRGEKTAPTFMEFLSQAERVCVREPVSYREMEGSVTNLEQAADCAFMAQPAPTDRARELLVGAGIEGPFAVMTGSASVRKWPIETQRAIVEELRGRGLDVLYTHSDRRDVDNLAALGVSKALGHEQVTYQELMALQAEAEILVGGRFHPTIFAALVGTPFVALPSNTHKMDGLMEMLGAKDLMHGFQDASGPLESLRRVLDDRERTGAALQAKAMEWRALAPVNAGLPAGWAEGNL